MSNPVEDVPIRDSMIRLGQLLKLANLVEDGVEATELIKNGLVKVNGEIDDRRGRQLRNGDTVTVNNQTVRVVAPEA
ncbi:RNA-binding S4 domain-containing protein [Arthrobacter nitrophenolicus]|jgi:ribosome-associated protein|uniref:RNA-binding S4 domain-containing protein n=2 Tax=Arthrobacter nitrophenolicus TaxID=683150 RepID=L8TNT8_9MICC|nr:RNA-binding S4 domain-containing protein [Arthrobacter nitrophenolicus]ELT42929.1 RNA-binding S4 domain-containing protein [Arthrobacter nitrophenolicus]TDL36324.1 RNA-binding S4 domain-containing protein [Arthrobacter nitrophenolicus]